MSDGTSRTGPEETAENGMNVPGRASGDITARTGGDAPAQSRADGRFDSIAFCGGGGKGAYHIGVWKALDELGLTAGVRAVSGTSIGGLNAVLFALGDREKARKIWYSVSEKDVFTVPSEFEGGIFSRSGLLAILDSLELQRLADCPVKVYVNVCDADTGGLEWFELNGCGPDMQRSLLLATTSLPLIYGTQEINGKKYWDGGMAMLRDGNVPITPLYENGCRRILVSSLDPDFSLGPELHPIKGPNARVRCPGAEITALRPLDDMGSFISGTLNFSPSAIRARMAAGYGDTLKQLNNEDVYFMRNNYSRINIQIANQMTRLFRTGAELERFIRQTNFSNVNIPMPTLGGHVFYTDIVNIDGWRLQQHNVWPLRSHYRILDPDNVRAAWVLDPDDILRALIAYEDAERFGEDGQA